MLAMNSRILQVIFALTSFLAFCCSLEIMNDAGVYTGPEDINVYISRDGSIYTPNDEEFYVVADYGSAVLFNTTSGEVLLSVPINASTTPEEAISNVLDLAVNTTDFILELIDISEYNQVLSSNIEKRSTKFCYLCSRPGMNCYQRECRGAWSGVSVAWCALNSATNRCNQMGKWIAAACRSCQCCS